MLDKLSTCIMCLYNTFATYCDIGSKNTPYQISLVQTLHFKYHMFKNSISHTTCSNTQYRILLHLYRNSVFLTIPYIVILHGCGMIKSDNARLAIYYSIRYIPSYFYLIPNLLDNHRALPPNLRHIVQFTNQRCRQTIPLELKGVLPTFQNNSWKLSFKIKTPKILEGRQTNQ
jgi:hypothetical protein